eukprot:CAMPEP_0183301042 /NCGR_PEP_ID=MMETSP0160_2-20130417/7265_1 /TAXON_ID=2839 ORGANISM="Odontella Sinensis, Strain Grunow 1884" /NCGR_SAMPLE_ID=MMETSP0160_2 /ASSEMBLY_ACC=CAM_ASM_000250 /LENGTH=261 /DNA_ID=CAMNT_0025463563 /DNA_START=17 /DNA_END=802 /DNA_ORIENTATION=+
MNLSGPSRTIAIFFSPGAFGDCARHAILHAIEDPRVGRIKLIAREPVVTTFLDEANWKCGCEDDHGNFIRKNSEKVERIAVDIASSETGELERLADALFGVDAVISGLGNRQPFLGDRVGTAGIKNVAAAMKKRGIDRLVMMSSTGIGEDSPCMEWRKEGKIMDFLFSTLCRREYYDLLGAEEEARDSGVNYVITRPVGLGEDVVPTGEYFLQKKKFEDVLGCSIAKMDVGKFLLDQVLEPTISKRAVVIGADPKKAFDSF